jgi:threonine-phosphate decarboxylase
MTEFLPPHGGQLRHIAERFGIPAASLLDFSANLNPEGPPAAVVTCLRESLRKPSMLVNYPDLDEMELRPSLARYAGVRPENVVAANGFVPLLDTALRVLPIQSCLVPVPAFVEYRRTLERSRVEMIPLLSQGKPFAPGAAFAYDTNELLSGSHRAVLLANPQNPSATLCPRETLIRLVEEANRRNVYVLIDEAFIDYCPEASLAGVIDQFPNLILFRSVTKFFGMAGLRVAYALANTEFARQVRDALAPWTITTLASIAARVAVEDEAYCRRTVDLNHTRRTQLRAGLDRLGVQVYPSIANFLLLRFSESVDSQQCWEQLVREHHIVLRNCANYEGLADGHLRTAIRTEAENDRLLEALAQVLGAVMVLERPHS